MAYECLTDLFGITRSECACEVEGMNKDGLPTDWYKQSTSGLFLDELEGIVPLQAIAKSQQCTNEMATWYNRSRATAIQTMADDILIGLTQRAVNGKKTYRGKMGGISVSSVMQMTDIMYGGLKMYTIPMKGGTLKIKAINVMMDADASFSLYVYKLVRGSTILEQVAEIPNVMSQANAVKVNTLTTPLEIQLSEYGADFFFLFQNTGAFRPKQTTTSCGCGNTEYQFKAYAQLNGVTGGDLTEAPAFRTYTYSLGLSLEGEIGCDTTKIICEAYTDQDSVKKVMAYTARFKAGELVQEYVSKSGNINRYTMVSQEYIWGKRNHFKSEYNSRINWLVENLNINLVDCYVCNDKRVRKGGILA